MTLKSTRSATATRIVTLLLAGLSSMALAGVEACSSSSHSAGKESGDAGADAHHVPDASIADSSHSDSTIPDSTADSAMPDDTTIPLDSSSPTDATLTEASPDSTVAADSTPPTTPDASMEASVTDAGLCDTDGGLPPDLSCTGLYSDFATQTVAAANLPYTPGYVLWSDGAVKSRWIYLPPGSQIDTTNMDDWVFPVGTKIWKQFVVGGTLIETRLMWKQASGWTFADYRWAADMSSAPLLTNGETNVNGTTYEVPPLYRCPSCHGGRIDDVLGFDLIGIGVSAAQGVTLAQLASSSMLTHSPPATTITIPEDSTGMAAPALGWLHVNCGVSCHNSNGGSMAMQTRLYSKLLAAQMYPPDGGTASVTSLDTYTTTVGVMSNLTPNGVHYQRIAPGQSDASLMPLMDMARGSDAGFSPMPPFVSHIPDTADVLLVQNWINAL